MWTIDANFKEAIKNDRLIVFAGAGLSQRFNLPNWSNLVKMIVSELEQRGAVEQGLSCFITLMEKNWLTPLQIISLLQKKYEVELLDFVSEKVRITGDQDFSLHEKIIELTEKIVTTNYDKAFEIASKQRLNSFTHSSRFDIASLQKRKGYVFKIHGDIDDLGNAVFFESNYKMLYNPVQEHPAIRELKSIFIGKTVLFIGFSLSDPYIEEIFTSVFEQYKFLGKHYLITTDRNFENSRHADYIRPIVIDDYSATHRLLEEMLATKGEGPKPTRRHNLKTKPYFSFIGREECVKNVMKRLKGDLSLVVIEGFPGVGKTSLAIEVGYACVDQSSLKYANTVLFDYVIWVSHSDNPSGNSWLGTVLDAIARVMDNKKIINIPVSKMELKEIEIENYLRNSFKKLLLIIDNFEVIEDPHLSYWITNKLPTGAKVLITTSMSVPVKQANVNLPGLSKGEALKFTFQIIENKGKVSTEKFPDAQLLDLIEVTNGNPRALELAIAAIAEGKLDLFRIKQELDPGLGDIFENLHERSWTNLKEESKMILALFPQFLGSRSISKDALYKTSSLPIAAMDKALLELLNWNLISFNPIDQRYTIHPITERFVRYKLNPSESERFKKRWSEYYLDFVRNNVIRDSPRSIYWNALVSDKMNALEEEWTAIQEVLQWVDENGPDEMLIEFVMLLVHFMDSRFYNQERIKFVVKAIAACEKNMNKGYEEALLRIDALGWTYAEESRFDDALKEINTGLEKLEIVPYPTNEKNNLKALAYAWQARIRLEQGFLEDSSLLLGKAKQFTVEPWIQTRIKMAEGDMYMQKENFIDAAECYLQAEKLTNPDEGGYGFEGHNYQINPRIGFAYLEIREFEQARDRFEDLEQDDHIAIGRLYGTYGLARIAFEESKELKSDEMKNAAIFKMKAIEEELHCRTNSNLLQMLIKKLLQLHLVQRNISFYRVAILRV